MSLYDVGTGAGHLVVAALQEGVRARGLDVSRKLINFASEMAMSRKAYFEGLFSCVDSESEVIRTIAKNDAQVVSFMCTLAHCRDLHGYLRAFTESKSTHIFALFPMFSLSSIFQQVFPAAFPRVMSGGHTHLFTNSSLAYLVNRYDLELVAEWRFGLDIADLRRSILVQLQRQDASSRFMERVSSDYLGLNIVDSLQKILDERSASDEIHVVWRKKSV